MMKSFQQPIRRFFFSTISASALCAFALHCGSDASPAETSDSGSTSDGKAPSGDGSSSDKDGSVVDDGGTGTPDAQAITQGTCTGSMSGAVTGAFTSCGTELKWNAADNTNAFAVNASLAAASPVQLTFHIIGLSGKPAAGTYTEKDSPGLGGVTISVDGSFETWRTSAAIGGLSVTGSYTAKWTTFDPEPADGAGQYFIVHGSLDATLVAIAPDSNGPPITIHAVF